MVLTVVGTWVATSEWMKKVKELFHHAVPRRTAYCCYYLKREKMAFEAGDGVRKEPDIVDFILRYKTGDIAEELILKEKPDERQHHMFPPMILYEKLKNEALDLKNCAGFGPELVAMPAIDIHAKHIHIEDEPELWITPSKTWCYWFMHTYA